MDTHSTHSMKSHWSFGWCFGYIEKCLKLLGTGFPSIFEILNGKLIILQGENQSGMQSETKWEVWEMKRKKNDPKLHETVEFKQQTNQIKRNEIHSHNSN